MSEPTHQEPEPAQPLPPAVAADLTRPPTIPPDVWAQIVAAREEQRAQNFRSRDEALAWLKAHGYVDMADDLRRVEAGGEL
jgi:hypothetical protein